MNIFELTRILNEVNSGKLKNTELATKVSKDILIYDKSIESSKNTNEKEKQKKNELLARVHNTIDDAVNEFSLRNKIFTKLVNNNFIPKNGTTKFSSEATIREILRRMSDEDAQKLNNYMEKPLKLRGNGDITVESGISANIVELLKNYRPYGCGPWEVFVGLVFNGKKASSGGDVQIGNQIYEIKLSNSGYIDNKKVKSESEYKTEESVLLQFFKNKPAILLMTDNGKYILVNKETFRPLLKHNVISFVKKSAGQETGFGNLALNYNVK